MAPGRDAGPQAERVRRLPRGGFVPGRGGDHVARRLAVWGGSNGGLLVGAAVTQRPELFTAAVCSAPLLDMVRYERFGLGETWNTEYGTASAAEELGWLLGYSPYHRVARRDGVSGGAVHRVHERHAGGSAARVQDVRGAPARDGVAAAGAAARRGPGRARAARGVADRRAGGGLPGVRGAGDGAGSA